MLNPITFEIKAESGPAVTIQASGLDYAAFEDAFDQSAIKGISEGRYKTITWIAWHAMHRQGQTTQTFEEFLASTPQLSAPEKVEEVPPLASKARAGS